MICICQNGDYVVQLELLRNILLQVICTRSRKPGQDIREKILDLLEGELLILSARVYNVNFVWIKQYNKNDLRKKSKLFKVDFDHLVPMNTISLSHNVIEHLHWVLLDNNIPELRSGFMLCCRSFSFCFHFQIDFMCRYCVAMATLPLHAWRHPGVQAKNL